ncbi:class I SAM-dependent methyltransferase [Sulfolobus sp. E3]|nr:class I SAM-dependent methyltransferase [Sulfolobus sp. E3]
MIFICPIDGSKIDDNLICEKGHKFNLIDNGIYDFLPSNVKIKTDQMLERIIPIYENLWAPFGMFITGRTSYSNFLRNIAEFISGGVVVDVGTGTGKIFDLLKCDRCIGIDISLNFLKYMKKKRKDVIAVRGDASNLPIKSNIADGVSSTLVLHMLPNPHLAIKEISRILKPKGKCGIAVLANVDSLMAKILSKMWKVNLRHYDYYINLLLSNSLQVVQRKEFGPWVIIKCIKAS